MHRTAVVYAYRCGVHAYRCGRVYLSDNEQHYRCVLWERKTVLQSQAVAFSAPSRKSSFLCVHSFSRWQSENQADSPLGRVRIITSDGTCVLLNAQQIKMVSRAYVCAITFEGQTKDYMCACVRTFVTSSEVLREC